MSRRKQVPQPDYRDGWRLAGEHLLPKTCNAIDGSRPRSSVGILCNRPSGHDSPHRHTEADGFVLSTWPAS